MNDVHNIKLIWHSKYLVASITIAELLQVGFRFSETFYFILVNLIIEETGGHAGFKSDLFISCDGCDGSTSFQIISPHEASHLM